MEKLEIVEELIRSGADVEKVDDFKLTPLTAALHQNNLKIVTILSTNRTNLNLIYLDFTPLQA